MSEAYLGYSVAAVDSFQQSDLKGLFLVHDGITSDQFRASCHLLVRFLTFELPNRLSEDPTVVAVMQTSWKSNMNRAIISVGVLEAVHEETISHKYGTGVQGEFTTFNGFLANLAPAVAAVEALETHAGLFLPAEQPFEVMTFLRNTAALSTTL